MKAYTITAITKANRTEYFHAVTVEAENVREAKEKASAIIRATLDRHAFRIANASAPASIEYAQWIADRFNTTVDAVMQAASRPEGVDAYDFKPAEAENPITPGNAPLYVWTFANGAESAATLAAEASSAADATEYARAARICANEATEAAEIAGTAEAAKDAERARIAADRAEQALQRAEYIEPAPAPMYQRFELEAYIGAENLEDYDVDAIEEEATEYDPATSRTVWKRGIDLATICERHEIAAYYPAAV